METGQKKAFAIDSKAETVALSPTKVEKPKHPVDEELLMDHRYSVETIAGPHG